MIALSRLTHLVVALGLLASSACGEDAPSSANGDRSRSESLTQSAGASVAVVKSAAPSATPRPRAPFCANKPKNAGEKPSLPKAMSLVASGEEALEGTIPLGKGKWTWLNLWAGWCGPCKQEMPLLQRWETQLKDKLRVVFLSVDDDERLALKFLNEQPATGVRKSFHFPPNDDRKSALEELSITNLSKLPTHVLLNPEGEVHCIISGAIEESDLPALQKLVGSAG